MPHLARHTVETTRSMRSKLVVGRRVSQDEPRKSLWLFSCNLPCKRCSEILPWPQTRIPPGEEDADDERLVLRIIRSTLPRRFSLPTLLPRFPPFLPSLPPFLFAVFYNSSLFFFLFFFFFSNSDLDIPPRFLLRVSEISLHWRIFRYRHSNPLFPCLFLLSRVICLNRCEPPFSPRCFWTLDELTDGDPLLRRLGFNHFSSLFRFDLPSPLPFFASLKEGELFANSNSGFKIANRVKKIIHRTEH